MAKMLCPDKSNPLWSALVKALGSKEDAYRAFFRNGDEIPTTEKARELLQKDEAKSDRDFVLTRRQMMLDQLAAAKGVEPTIKREQKAELKERLGQAVAVQQYLVEQGMDPVEAHRRAYAKLAGPQTDYEQRYESIREKLGDEFVQKFRGDIVQDESIQWLDRDKLVQITDKLSDGSYVTQGEADLFGKYFGPEAQKLAQARVPLADQFWVNIAEILGIPRTTFASFDVSGIMRQARALGQAHPREWAKMAEHYGKAFWSEENARQVEALTRSSPRYAEYKDVGLELTEWENVKENIQKVEEAFSFMRHIENIPGIKASARSFTTSLNWLRMTVYDKLVTQTETARGREMTLREKRNLAKMINHLSGRASLPDKGRNLALMLNAVAFSPRFALSRLLLPVDVGLAAARSVVAFEPGSWKPQVRLEAQPELALGIRSVASMMMTNIAIIGLAKLALGDDLKIEGDLRSTDTWRLRIGAMRIDPWAGYQTSVRFLVRLIRAETKSQSGEVREQTRWKILGDFLRGKTSPLAGLVIDAISRETMLGEPVLEPPRGIARDVMNELGIPDAWQGAFRQAWNRSAPGVAQDTLDALTTEGVPQSLTAMALATLGVGVQTYATSAVTALADYRNGLAQTGYGKRWNDLKLSQQLDLRRKNSQMAEMELQVKRESPPQVSLDNTEVLRSSKRIYGTLSPEVQQAAKEAAAGLGLQRRIGPQGGLYLHDARYQEYEKRAAAQIQTNLTKLLSLPLYERATPATRPLLVQKVVAEAKEQARNALLRDIEQEKTP